MRRLRVLHIGNGLAFKIRAIVDAFLARGHEMHMVPIPPSDAPWPGVEWHSLPMTSVPRPGRVPARALAVRQLARRLQPDLIHSHNAWGPGWYGAFAGIHPHVIHAYGGDLLPEQYAARPRLQRALTAWAGRRADLIVVTGAHMIEAAGRLGIPASKLFLLPRGVDVARYRPGLDTSEFRRRHGLEGRFPVILSPRYQVDESLYNLDVVIDAFAQVRRAYPGAVCLQLADERRAAGRARLAARAESLGLGDSYRLHPAVDNQDMPVYYNAADVAVSVPSSDGFPVTVLEAAACGTPLVVSRLPYCREWFVEGDNGLLVAPGSATELAEAVLALCGDAELRRRFGAAGRTQVEQRADYGRCMGRLEDTYFELIERCGPRRRTGS